MGEESQALDAASELEQAKRLLSSTAIRALAEDRWRRWRPWIDWPLLALFVVSLTLLLTPFGPRVITVPPLDSIATETVRAERDVLVPDPHATELRREAVRQAALPVFDYDPDLYIVLSERVEAAVQAMSTRKSEGVIEAGQRRAAFESDLGQPVNAATLALIEGLERPQDLAGAIGYFLQTGLDRMVVADRQALPEGRDILVRNVSLGRSYPIAHLGRVIDAAQLQRLMQARAGNAPYGSARIVRTWALQTAEAMAVPNLVANPALTAERLKTALDSVEPVYVRLNSGEVVIREGDRVTSAVQERLRILNRVAGQRTPWGEPIAFGALLCGLIGLGAFFFRGSRRPLRLGRKACYLALTIVGVTALICLSALHGGRGFAEGLGLPPVTAAYLMPVALVTLLVGLLVDSRTSLLAGVGLTLLVSYRADGGMWLVTYFLIGVLVAGATARHCKRRGDLLKIGLAVGICQAAVVPIIMVLSNPSIEASDMWPMASAISAGLITAISALGLMPLLEYVFNETTDMRLMEMASADNPLLERLALTSPGTYFHSVVMGNLAEAAADAIDANALQCRVMALYHDIGKMRRPSYFAENQKTGNIHDRLPPELSARIIFAHIKDGIDIALKHRLGRPVLDAITQHQGTTLLRAFYAKAVERARAVGRSVDEDEFRYPGPKPMSKEAGILMLADATEASTRALKDPAPAEVKARIHDVIAERIADGQLDDCQLTMKDLAAIEEAFTRVVTLGVYHSRIEYPAPIRAENGKNDGQQTGDQRISPLRSLADRGR